MGEDPEQRQHEREAIDNPQQSLNHDNSVDESGEESLGNDGVFFDELGKVVQSRGWWFMLARRVEQATKQEHTNGQSQEDEAQHGSNYPEDWQDPHVGVFSVWAWEEAKLRKKSERNWKMGRKRD